MKNCRANPDNKICSRLKSTLILSLITLLSFTPPAFAEFTIRQDQRVDLNPPDATPFEASVVSDNEGYDFIIWHERKIAGHFIKTRTYWMESPIGDEVLIDSAPDNEGLGSPVMCTPQKGTIISVWDKVTSPQNTSLYSAVSFNYGMSWSTPTRINQQIYYQNFEPVLRCDNQGGVYVAWIGKPERNNVNNVLAFNRSLDYGTTWLPQDVQLSKFTFPYNPRHPALALGRDGLVYLAWISKPASTRPSHVYFKRSTDYGETWPSVANQIDRNFYPSGPNITHIDYAMASDQNGMVYIAWEEWTQRNKRLALNRSPDGGQTWQKEDQIIGESPLFDVWFSSLNVFEAPDLLATDNQGHVYVAFSLRDRELFNERVGFNLSSDYGTTWGSTTAIITPPRLPANLAIRLAADGNGKIYVVTSSTFPDAHIHMNASEDYGQTWVYETAGAQVDSVDPGRTTYARYAVIRCNQNGHSAIVWVDDRLQTRAQYQLYYNTAEFTK